MKPTDDRIKYNYTSGLYEIAVNGREASYLSLEEAEDAVEYYNKLALKEKKTDDRIKFNYTSGLYGIRVNGKVISCLSLEDAQEALEYYDAPTIRETIESQLNEQVGGDHYKSQDIQPWDYMEACMTEEQFIGYLRGNVIKYVSRYDKKGGIQDIDKALQYLNKLRSAL